MQLIIHLEVTDFATWKRAFDNDAEARSAAGLTVLQIWKDADSDTRASVLLSVNDRARAQAWLDRSAALSGDDAGTVRGTSSHFLKTA